MLDFVVNRSNGHSDPNKAHRTRKHHPWKHLPKAYDARKLSGWCCGDGFENNGVRKSSRCMLRQGLSLQTLQGTNGRTHGNFQIAGPLILTTDQAIWLESFRWHQWLMPPTNAAPAAIEHPSGKHWWLLYRPQHREWSWPNAFCQTSSRPSPIAPPSQGKQWLHRSCLSRGGVRCLLVWHRTRSALLATEHFFHRHWQLCCSWRHQVKCSFLARCEINSRPDEVYYTFQKLRWLHCGSADQGLPWNWPWHPRSWMPTAIEHPSRKHWWQHYKWSNPDVSLQCTWKPWKTVPAPIARPFHMHW